MEPADVDRGLQPEPRPHGWEVDVGVAHELEPSALDRAQRTLTGYGSDFRVDSIGLYEHGSDGHWRDRLRFEFGLDGT